VRALGRYDIGQSVVVSDGTIEAIEGAEGTDGMLVRLAKARGMASGARRGVLVKRTKPGQDLRVDMPAIGPETSVRVAEAGLRGIAVEAGRVLVAQRAETIARANAAAVFIAGCVDETAGIDGGPASGPGISPLRPLGKRGADARSEPDIRVALPCSRASNRSTWDMRSPSWAGMCWRWRRARA
jgi:hypothetical protein